MSGGEIALLVIAGLVVLLFAAVLGPGWRARRRRHRRQGGSDGGEAGLFAAVFADGGRGRSHDGGADGDGGGGGGE